LLAFTQLSETPLEGHIHMRRHLLLYIPIQGGYSRTVLEDKKVALHL